MRRAAIEVVSNENQSIVEMNTRVPELSITEWTPLMLPTEFKEAATAQ